MIGAKGVERFVGLFGTISSRIGLLREVNMLKGRNSVDKGGGKSGYGGKRESVFSRNRYRAVEGVEGVKDAFDELATTLQNPAPL